MKIADLFARIGLKVDSEKLEKFRSQLQNVGKVMAASVAAAGVVAAGLNKISKEAMNAAASLKQFEAETGASSQELQKWQAVANETNNSAEAVTSSIKALAANRESLRLGKGGNITTFQMLGIDPMQDPFTIMEQLREKTATLGPAMKKNLLTQAGVSAELIQVLDLSNDQFNQMASRAFIVPPSAIASLDKARGATQRMGNAFTYIKTLIGAAVSPNIEKMSKAFSDFVKQNEGKILKAAKTLADLLGKLSRAVLTVISTIDKLIQRTVGYKAAIMAIAGVFIALNSAVLLPIAGIVLLFAIIEDFVRYSQGKSSVVGRLFDKFPLLEEIFQKMVKPIKEFIQLLGAVFDGDWKGIDEILDKWGAFGDIIQGIVKGLEAIKSFANTDAGATTFEAVSASSTNQGARALGLGLLSGRSAGAAVANRFTQNSNTNNVNITVNGSGDPEATGQAVQRAFQKATDERRGGIVE